MDLFKPCYLYLLSLLVLFLSCVSISNNQWSYHCKDGYEFTLIYSSKSDAVLLEDATGISELQHVPSGSGAKYSDGKRTVFTKGSEAFIESDGAIIHKDCTGVVH